MRLFCKEVINIKLKYEEKTIPTRPAQEWSESKYKGCRIKLIRDQDAESPDDWGDESLFLVGYHRDFSVERDDAISKEDLITHFNGEKIAQAKDYFIFGLEAYIHSGVVLALTNGGNFPDRQWDVSKLGAVLVSKKEARGRKAAEKLARSLVDKWNTYLSGDIFGFVIEDKDGKDMDSCWGFYGIEEAEEAAIESIEASRTS